MNHLLLLVTVPYSANDAIQCERLLDLIAIWNRKKPKGHCLLVSAPDTHAETQAKMRIAAEVAFETVDCLNVPWPAVESPSRAAAINNLWWQAATHAARAHQWPFLWLEPDAVPLNPNWLKQLTDEYYSQSKRYLGSIMSTPDGKLKCLSRVAIYPRGAGGELKEFVVANTPFEIISGHFVIPRAAKTTQIQQMAYGSISDRLSIRDDAVLLHHDKQGVLLSALLEEAETMARLVPNPDVKIDRRSREGRLALAQLKAAR